MGTTSILLVEDHEVFAKALLRVLSGNKDLNVVAVAESAERALEQLSDLSVDLVLADVSLPHMNGINLVGEIRAKYPDLRCAVLSGHLSPDYVQRALEAGAHGYMVKDNPGGILEGIRHIMKGEVYISKEVGNTLNEPPTATLPPYGDNPRSTTSNV
ncbi:MAG TPA: response regulator transcription factor [Anaerolineales bacterium]|jgi:DNA-binding NarL/FixJ family response regulator|nr:response regulator transcription factor [Anaerolineales bacterium]